MSRLTDPYEVAIVTYALTLTNSPAKESALNAMHKIRREGGKFAFLFLNKPMFQYS
jgi:CD109 antigen